MAGTNGGNIVIKVIDQETGQEFDKEREWMATCLATMRRKGRPRAKSKTRFNPLDKIHLFEQGQDMGSLRHVLATCEKQEESAVAESESSEDEEQSNSRGEEECSWETLECLMNASEEEGSEMEDSDAKSRIAQTSCEAALESTECH